MLDRTIQPVIKALNEIQLQVPVEENMPNGIPLHIINAGEQDVVRVDIIIKGGRYQQSKPLQAMFANRMLREGCAKYTSAEIAEYLDYYGAWLELTTSFNHSYITLYSLSKYYSKTLEIVESIIKYPTYPEKELQTILEINKQKLQIDCRKVDFISQKYFNLAVFGNDHPSGNSITLDDYDRLRQSDLIQFHQQYYNFGNCSVFLSGNITEEIVSNTIALFGREKWGKEQKSIVLSPPLICQRTEKKLFIEKTDAMQGSIRMGMLTMERSHPDYLKMRVLMTLFGGYFGSRLMTNIREDKGYTYGISAGILFYPGTGLLMISTEADNQYIPLIINEVYTEINKLRDNLISQEELDMVKNYMTGNMSRDFEGPFSIADVWMLLETEGLNKDYFQKTLDAILDITKEEIRELAQKHLLTNDLIEVVAGKKNHNKV